MTATQVLAVLAPQLGQQAAALLHLGEAGRVVLPALDLVAQRAGHVGQLDARRSQPVAVGVEDARTGERRGGPRQQVERAALARRRIERQGRTERGLAVGRGVGQAVLLEPQRGLLVGILEAGRRDLVHLVAQDVGLAGPLLRVAAQGGQRLVERAQLAAQGAHAAEVGAGEGVEDVALRGRGDQRAVLVLPVDLDQVRRRLAQRAHRRHAAVDPGAGAPLGGDRAGQDDLARSSPSPSPSDEARLDQGLGGARPHHAGTGPAAQHELERLDHQRLAGAGLAGQRRHARAEGQREVLDHPEVADVQVGQHGAALARSLRTPGRPAAGSAGCRRRSAARCARRAPGGRATLQVTVAPGCQPPDLRPVDDEHAGAVGRDLDADLLRLGQHEAAVEREVRGHRRHHHGAQRRAPGWARRPRGCRRSNRSAWR